MPVTLEFRADTKTLFLEISDGSAEEILYAAQKLNNHHNDIAHIDLTLFLSDNSNHVTHLVNALMRKTNLKSLLIEAAYNEEYDDDTQATLLQSATNNLQLAIAVILEHCSLEAIHFQEFELDNTATGTLAQALNGNTRLRELDLKHSTVSIKGIQKLFNAIQNTHISSLAITLNSSIDTFENINNITTSLINMFTINAALNEICIESNSLGEQLHDNFLNALGNNMTFVGNAITMALVGIHKNLRPLKKISLDHLSIREEAALTLFKAIGEKSGLESLQIHEPLLFSSVRMHRGIAALIHLNSSLRTLNLKNDECFTLSSPAVRDSFITALKNNTNLRDLTIEIINWDANQRTALVNAIKENLNSSITCLSFKNFGYDINGANFKAEPEDAPLIEACRLINEYRNTMTTVWDTFAISYVSKTKQNPGSVLKHTSTNIIRNVGSFIAPKPKLTVSL